MARGYRGDVQKHNLPPVKGGPLLALSVDSFRRKSLIPHILQPNIDSLSLSLSHFCFGSRDPLYFTRHNTVFFRPPRLSPN